MSEGEVNGIKNAIVDLSATFKSEMKHTRDDIIGMRSDQKEQSAKINNMTQTIAVMNTKNSNHEEEVAYKFKEVDEKLCRDYHKLNELEKKSIKANGVDEYKKATKEIIQEKRSTVKYMLYVIAAILGLLITANSVKGIVSPYIHRPETKIEYRYLPSPTEEPAKDHNDDSIN